MLSWYTLDDEITISEVQKAVEKVWAASSSVQFPLNTESFKQVARCEASFGILCSAFNEIFCSCVSSGGWREGLLTPIPKPGKELKAKNCRPIVLEVLPMRILSTILQPGMKTGPRPKKIRVVTVLVEAQLTRHGFLQALCETQLEKKKNSLRSVLDYTCALNTVNHHKLLTKLLRMGISRKMLQFLLAMYEGSTNRVKWNGKLSDSYRFSSSVRQRDPLSAMLCVIYINGL